VPPEETLEGLLRSPVAYGAAFVLGALLGSFANVCILRIPAGASIVRPGSRCGACGTPIRWYDNVPILSWLLLRGRCRACRERVSPRYLLVEAATALRVLAAFHFCIAQFQVDDPAPTRLARFAIYALFLLALVVLTFIDLDHRKIPDRITYPGIPVFLALGLLLGDRPWTDLAIGVAVGYGIVRLVSDGYYYLTGREGLGYGDGKLLALVGALLGWRGVVFALFGGALLGSVIGVAAVVVARRRAPAGEERPALRHVELPFGPFLVAAAIGYLFLQAQIEVSIAELFAW
jgi:leader peptidase (prepilin peptidase) / N-methyltransferase